MNLINLNINPVSLFHYHTLMKVIIISKIQLVVYECLSMLRSDWLNNY